MLFSSEAMMKAAASGILLLCGSCMSIDISRRRTLRAFSAPVAVAALPMPALAATKKYSAADAQNAIRELKEARVALDGMDNAAGRPDQASAYPCRLLHAACHRAHACTRACLAVRG